MNLILFKWRSTVFFERVDERPSTLLTVFVLAEAGTLSFYPVIGFLHPNDSVASILIGTFLISGVSLPFISLALWRSRRGAAVMGLATFGLALSALIFRF
jgi:hypothetical protein